MPWRTAGSNGDVYFFHLVAPEISPALPSWSGPRAEAQAGHDPAATAVPGLRPKALKGWAGQVQHTAPSCSSGSTLPSIPKPVQARITTI